MKPEICKNMQNHIKNFSNIFNLNNSWPFVPFIKQQVCDLYIYLTITRNIAALAEMVACLPLVQQVRGSIPGGVVNFHLEIFNLGARRGGDVPFLIARLYNHRPGLNSKPFRSIYVEKVCNTVDSDSSVGWGR